MERADSAGDARALTVQLDVSLRLSIWKRTREECDNKLIAACNVVALGARRKDVTFRPLSVTEYRA